MKKKQKGGTIDTMNSGIPKKKVVSLKEPLYKPSKGSLKEIAGIGPIEDTRSFFNDRRAKERGDQLWNGVKKVTAGAQYVPVPMIKYPAMAINSTMGMVDTYEDLKKGDFNNAYLDAIGALPLPGSKKIKALGAGLGPKVIAKATRAASAASIIDAVGTASDLTDNGTNVFGWKSKKEKGGTISEQGYKNNSPYKNRKSIDINTPSGLITTKDMAFPILANGVPLYPNTGDYQFNTDKVTEIPMKKIKKAQNGLKYSPELITSASSRQPAAQINPNKLGGDYNGAKKSLLPSIDLDFDLGNAVQVAGALYNEFMPDQPNRKYLRPEQLQSYNPNAYGSGSQAIMQQGGTLKMNKKDVLSMTKQAIPATYNSSDSEIANFGNYAGSDTKEMASKLLATGLKGNQFNEVQGQYTKGDPLKAISSWLPSATTEILKSARIKNFHTLEDFKYNKEYLTNNSFKEALNHPVFAQNFPNYWETVTALAQEQYKKETPKPTTGVAIKAKGGKVSKINAGGLQTYEGGSAPLESYNPIDGGMGEFKGNSHENGGIASTFNGKPFEAEGGEPYRIDQEGSLEIFGNLVNPLSGNKFKKDAKVISKQEKKAQKYLDKGTELVNNIDPVGKYDTLAFNSGTAMLKGGLSKQKQLAQEKNKLSAIQQMLLGENPNVMNNGGIMKFQDGGVLDTFSKMDFNDPRLKFVTTLNKTKAELERLYPGKKIEVKFNGLGKDRSLAQQMAIVASQKKAGKQLSSEFSAHNFDAARDYNIYIDGKPAPKSIYQNTLHRIGKEEGLFPLKGSASDDYFHMGLVEEGKGNTASDILKKYPSIAKTEAASKYFSEAENLPDRKKSINKAYYALKDAGTNLYKQPFTPKTIPQDAKIQGENLVDPITPITPWTPENRLPKQSPVEPKTYDPITAPTFNFENPVTKPFQAPKRNRPWEQIVPAIPQLFDQADPVLMQQYTPDLLNPYSVTFQDRRNQNESQLSGIRKIAQDNPSALGVFGAQAYEANNSVNGEEFRTNQGIYNDITNKNVATLNDAKLKNLSLTDQQYGRQTQAIANTRDRRTAAGIQIGDILAKNNLENKTLDVTSQLYKNYAYDKDMQLQYVGGPQSIGTSELNSPAKSVVQTTQGNTKTTDTYLPNQFKLAPVHLLDGMKKNWAKNYKKDGGKVKLSDISKLMYNQ